MIPSPLDEPRPAQGRHFSNWLMEYMLHSSHSEAPDPIHFWTSVSMVAGALRRHVWIEEFNFRWTPNFYIILVAPPAIATKSSSVDLGVSILQQVEGIKFGPDSMTWQGLTVALEEAANVVEIDDIILTSSAITCAVSELGTFLKTQDRDLLAVLTDLWDCKRKPWRHRIKTGNKPTTEIINPWINVIGCTTPSWLRENFTHEIIEGGLTSRCTFVFANMKRRLVPYPSLEISADEFYTRERLLVEDLTIISKLAGQYRLTPDAIKWGAEWYDELWGTIPVEVGDRFSGYKGRKQTMIHKLAMVIAASQRNELYITAEDLMAANRCILGIEADTQKLFRRIGATSIARQREEILEHLQMVGMCSETVLWKLFMTFVNRREFQEIMEGLVAAKAVYSFTDQNDERQYAIVEQETPG